MEKPRIKRENFILQKMKLIKGGGLHIEFIEKHMDSNEIENWIKMKMDNPVVPNNDLILSLNAFKPVIIESLWFDNAKMKNFTPEDLISCSAVSISGEKKKGIIVSGKLRTPDSSTVAVNSNRVIIDNSNYQSAHDIQYLIDELELEAYLYIYTGKKSKSTLFDNQDDEKPKK